MMKNKKEHKTALPELRFPEFRDSEGWILSPLSQLLDYERPDSYIVSDTNYCNDGTPVLTANKSFILGYTKEDYGICNNVPVVIFDDFTVDKKYVDFPFKVKSSAIKILRPKKDNNLRFAFELMNCIKFETAEHKRYYISSYQTQTVPIPQPNEQNKIANCFSSLDDLISAVTDKIEVLKEHKKGLMQQLFPAEGKTTPTLRFPEFQNAPAWKPKSLGSIGEIITGNTPATKEQSNYGGDRLFVSPADISNERYVSKTKTTLTEQGFSQSRCIKENSILFVCIGSTIGKIAQNTIECATNQQINSIVPYAGYISDFVYSLLEYNASKIASTASNQAVPIINKTEFSAVTLFMPKEDEQQAIADCLSSIDDQITAETQKLDQLKAHKKGLMQRLFPKV